MMLRSDLWLPSSQITRNHRDRQPTAPCCMEAAPKMLGSPGGELMASYVYWHPLRSRHQDGISWVRGSLGTRPVREDGEGGRELGALTDIDTGRAQGREAGKVGVHLRLHCISRCTQPGCQRHTRRALCLPGTVPCWELGGAVRGALGGTCSGGGFWGAVLKR